MFIHKGQNHNGVSISLEGTPEEMYEMLRYAASAAAYRANGPMKYGTKEEYNADKARFIALSETVRDAAGLIIPISQ